MRASFRFVTVAIVIAAIVVAALVVYDRFSPHTTDRSSPVVLKAVQDLGRFEAASGEFQVLVDLKEDGPLWDFLSSRHVLFVAVGSVDCYVDFAALGTKTITVSPDRLTTTITLPAPSFEKANLDNSRSYVYSVSDGLFQTVSDVFGQDQSLEQKAYIAGEQKITDAATAAGLQARAEENTRRTLTGMLEALGFHTVTINFPPKS